MNTAALQQEYARLRAQLAEAYDAPVWQTGRIDRLANALAAVERQLAAQAPDTPWCDTRRPRPLGRTRQSPSSPSPREARTTKPATK
ncbi:MAG: hypothetical protein KatS3mg122_1447 [Caldimonas sp.]|uniref:hypothetical protein n=1 Tax=Caldimonas TaxID=196013 RepID=UPI0012EAE04C|nr:MULTISPECIES: hypothetical protein [Caldimonas]GIX24216.1 MAG: hypothetical protein KatS3mg122_1447 [Caldimonas sp.]